MTGIGSALDMSLVESRGFAPQREYNCKSCNDRGYVPADNGTAYRRCECLIRQIQERRFDRLLKAANMADLAHMSLSSYKPKNASQKKAFDAVSARHGSYYFFGPWGVGKTHLMAGSVLRAIRNHVPSVLISVPKMLDSIRKQGRDLDTDIETLAMSIPYLCLDDIGKQKDSDWTEERLFMLLDERSKGQHSGRCFTSFTSQLDPDMLSSRMDGAIVSRIRGMCSVVFVDGSDQRGQGIDK